MFPCLLNAAFRACLNFVHLAEQKHIWSQLHLSDAAAVIRSCAVSKRGTWSANAISSQQHHITRPLPQFRQQHTPSPSPSDPLSPSGLVQKSSWRPNAEWFVPRALSPPDSSSVQNRQIFHHQADVQHRSPYWSRKMERKRPVVWEHQHRTALKCRILKLRLFVWIFYH